MVTSLDPTRYEVTARHVDGRVFLVCYTPSTSRRGLFSAIEGKIKSLGAIIGAPESWSWCVMKAKADRFHSVVVNGEWVITFSGRTQRDANTTGKLPFVADVARKAA